MSKLIKAYNLLGHKTNVAYTKYVKEGNMSKRHKVGREDMRKILDTICQHMADGVAETPGGTYVKGLGYFFNWKCPKKMSYHILKKGGTSEERFNYHSDHYMYFPTYDCATTKLSIRNLWAMDKKFNASLRKRISVKIKAGFEYRSYLDSPKS